jgi:multifunctional beta-oxidation protein
VGNFDNTGTGETASSSDVPHADPEDSDLVLKAKKEVTEVVEYSYTERDIILYNLGIGATEKELQWTYEGDENFSALPTFGVIPQFLASGSLSLDWLPNWNPVIMPQLIFGRIAD